MAILATNIQKARHPMSPVTITLLVDSEERTETLRLNRCTISPASRTQFKETYDATAPDKEEVIRLIVMAEVQSPDIVDAEGKPFPLTPEYLDGVDDRVLLSMWNSLQESRSPNVQTSTSTNNG
jgi:hypothetical protein